MEMVKTNGKKKNNIHYIFSPKHIIINLKILFRTGLCPTLTAPTNGFVVMTGNTVSSIAMYSCISNYALVGYEVRECTATAGWNRVEPICCKLLCSSIIILTYKVNHITTTTSFYIVRMCEGLNITNGIVNIDMDQPVEGAIATYTCNSGYRLSININRLCQREGIWSGVEPTCEGNKGVYIYRYIYSYL